MISLLRSRVPCNYRTLCFALFMGSVLSVPIGMILALTSRPFEPPTWTESLYWSAVLISLVLLPFWSDSALCDQPLLRRIGLVTFTVALIPIGLGLLFPAV